MDARPRTAAPSPPGSPPGLLAPVDGQVEHRIGATHRLVAPAGGPVALEDLITVTQVAHVIPKCRRRSARRARSRAPSRRASPSPGTPGSGHSRGTAPGRRPRTSRLSSAGSSSSTWAMSFVEPSHWPAAGALSYHIMYDAKSCCLPRRCRPGEPRRPVQRRGRVDLDHRQPPAGGGDRVALASVGLLAEPERVDSCCQVSRSTMAALRSCWSPSLVVRVISDIDRRPTGNPSEAGRPHRAARRAHERARAAVGPQGEQPLSTGFVERLIGLGATEVQRPPTRSHGGHR